VVVPQPAVGGETTIKLLFDESEQMSVIAK